MPIGLECYSCDNGAYPEQCIDSPESIPYGSVTCKPEYDHCFTRRYEEADGSKLMRLSSGDDNFSKLSPIRDHFQPRLLYTQRGQPGMPTWR